MSAEAAFVHFIRPMMAAFKDPPSGDPEAFFASLSDELSAFTAYQLDAGARQMKRERTTRTFPTIAECIAVCDRWPKEAPPERPEPVAEDADLGAAWNRRKRALDLMRGDYAMARQASKEGWLGQLFDYAMEQGRLPPPEAASRLKAQAEHLRGELARVSGSLGLGLIDAYRARYKTIQDGVFGSAA